MMVNRLALVGTLVLLGACDGGSEAPGGGSSGGGSAGEDGSGSGGTSTGGAASGGSATGGEPGGEAGSGQGGAGGAACPMDAPTQGADCEGREGTACAYETSGCYCKADAPNAGTWQCQAGAGEVCEGGEPATGSCTATDVCIHGSGFCSCAGSMWVCPGM